MLTPLSGLSIIDFSHRLPGPLCAKILMDLGATVIKIEDHTYQDPFLLGELSKIDDSFVSWYKKLNTGKNILRFDFNSSTDQKKIKDLIVTSDAVILGLPQKIREILKITNDDLNLQRPMVVIELLASSHEKKALHDLNALAMSGLLSLYTAGHSEKIVNPPFLPIAGISFGQKAATDLLAAYIKATKMNQTQFVKTYLDQVTKDLLGIFWPEKERADGKTRFLHNGAYPCYSLYQTQDLKYIALAAIEEKFWIKFCEVFKIDPSLDRFYNKDQRIFETVSNVIYKHSLFEIESLIKDEDICLSIIN